jgi:glycosyltransferase involved in cell wall biosynthesis
MTDLPMVSIVTPSFNMARFLPETIESVLSQDYPRIEYIVMDAGSTDGTLDILRSYGDRIRWISEKDNGQADAVNKGFERSTGEIFTFLNADDVYYPGAVSAAVNAFLEHRECAVVYGDANYTRDDGSILSPYPVQPFDSRLLAHLCYICQPASFIKRSVFAEVGMLDPSLHLTLDYDLWLRIAKRYPMHKVDRVLATCRMYAGNKTIGRREETFREIVRITRRHCNYVPLNWLYGYAGFKLDGRDGFFEHSPASLKKFLLTLLLGLRYNPTRPHKLLWEGVRGIPLVVKTYKRDRSA